MKLIVEVSDCRDCPCRKHNYGHGECFDYCSHKDSPKGYDNILWGCQESFKGIPKWCPIVDNEND